MKKNVLFLTAFLIFANIVFAQTGYIYVHKRALNETASIDFPFIISSKPGHTSVAPFVLNDQPAQLRVKDIGSSQNGRLWAIDETTHILYYRDVTSNAWVATSITDANRVDGDTTGNAVYINTSGTVFTTDGTTTTAISTAAAYSGNADIGSGWDGLPYITQGGIIYRYSGVGNIWNTISDQSANYSSYAIDVNPLTGDAYVAVKSTANIVGVIKVTAAGVVTNIGAPGWLGSSASTFPRDIAVNDKGEVFITAYSGLAPVGWYVFKYNGTWSVKEDASFDASGLTAGVGGEVWITMNSGGQGTGLPTVPYYNIFTRATDGTNIFYIDDERVRTTAGNSILIPVMPGTYTITEGVSSGWDLQTITLDDPTGNSTSNQVAGTADINVSAGEIVNVVFQNGELNPIAMTNNCASSYVETFGTGSVGTFGTLVPGQTSYHFLTNNVRAEDGYCKIVSTAFPDFNNWQATPFYDHTAGNGTGRMYAVNAGYDKGEFFRRRFTGIISGATYTFSAWAANLTPGGNNIRPNIKFQVLDHTTQNVLGTYNSGDINTATSQWNQYGFTFIGTSADIDLILSNNAIGGNGNDLAIDDITFALIPSGNPITTVAHSSCGTLGSITVTSPIGASFEYSKDAVVWQSSTLFANLVPGVYTTYARFAGTVGCVTSKTDTVKAAICGNVYNDVNGLKDNTVNGTGTNASGTLIAVLYDNTTGKVADTAYVTASGTYTLHSVLGDNYAVYLTTTTATIGQTAVPVVTLPTGWVNAGEYFGSGAGSDGTVNGILSIGVFSNSINNVNFGIEQPPVAAADQSLNNITGAAVTINPLTNDTDNSPGTLDPTTVSLVAPTGATGIITDAHGDIVSMNIPGEGVWSVDTTSGAITFTPQPGFNGNPTVQQYNVKDNAGFTSNNTTITIGYLAPITITGTVINDLNANTLLDGTETGTTAGTNLYVYLVNASGIVVDSAKVLSNGTYTLDAGQNLNYTLELSTTQYPVGTNITITPIDTTPPYGWISTGENGNGNTGFGDGTADGMLTLTTGAANVTQQNFGIEQPLMLGSIVWVDSNDNGIRDNSEPLYPAGTTVNLYVDANNDNIADGPAVATTTTDISGQYSFLHLAPNNYIVGIVIPAGYTSSNVNGGDPDNNIFNDNNGIYVSNGEVRSDAITLSVYGEPTKLGPTGGNVNFTLNFGLVPFIQISGNVLDDANGLTDNTVNGTGTNASGLNAVLIDAVADTVVAVVPVAANGTYNFTAGAGNNYTVAITTNNAVVGAVSPSVALPTNWVSTGENRGAGAGSDGTVNSTLPLGIVTTAITNANFGLDQLPVSDVKNYTITPPSPNAVILLDGTGATPGPLSGTDNEDGILGTTNTVVITKAPAQNQLYYDGVLVTDNTVITNYDPAKLTVKFTSLGYIGVTFQYAFVDSAGQQSPVPATYTIMWTRPLPVVLGNFNATLQNNIAVLQWNTQVEINLTSFAVQRSTDGVNWATVGTVKANDNNAANYSFSDINITNGIYYYRLAIAENSGAVQYSITRMLNIKNATTINAFPNPVTNMLYIQTNNVKNIQQVNLTDSKGSLVYTTSNVQSGIPVSKLSAGLYILYIYETNGNIQVEKIIKH